MDHKIIQGIDTVTFLKGIAILGVVLVHSPLCMGGINPYLSQITRIGQYGCQLFFLISGYLMMSSWNRLGEIPFKKKLLVFYTKRCCSIIPVYFVAILFYQIISLLYEQFWDGPFFYEIHHEIYSILLNVFLLHGFDYYNFNSIVPGGWFIGTIFLFYIVFPFLRNVIVRMERNNYKLLVLLPLFAFFISFVVQYLIYHYQGTWVYSKRGGFLYYSLLNQLPCMICGMLIGVKRLNEDRNRMKNGHKLVLMIGYCIISLFLFFIMRREYYVFILFPLTISLSFYYLYYLIDAIIHKPIVQNSLFCRVVSKFGQLSFAIYFSNFLGGMFIPWLVVIYFNHINISYSPTILYLLLLPFIFLVSYLLAIPIQSFINYSKNLYSHKSRF